MRGASVHIVHHALHHLLQAGGHRFRFGAYLREAVSNKLQALHVLTHLRYKRVLWIGLAQHVRPCHQARYRRPQLVGRLFGKTHPHLVLFGALRRQEREESHRDKDKHHAHLSERIDREPFQNERLVVTHIDKIVRSYLVVTAGGA